MSGVHRVRPLVDQGVAVALAEAHQIMREDQPANRKLSRHDWMGSTISAIVTEWAVATPRSEHAADALTANGMPLGCSV